MADEKKFIEDVESVSVDPTVAVLLKKAHEDGVETAFDRAAIGQKNRCSFGADGICCRICSMGLAASQRKLLRVFVAPQRQPLRREISPYDCWRSFCALRPWPLGR